MTGSASRTQSLVKRSCSVSASKSSKRLKRSEDGLMTKLPDEILLVIMEYVVFLDRRTELRLVCRQFDRVVSSLLLSSISAFASSLSFEGHGVEFRTKRLWKPVNSCRKDEPLCPIDSHIRHVTIHLSHYKNYANYVPPRKIKAYKSLLGRIERHMPALRSMKLLYYLSAFDLASGKAQMGMNTLITSALNCIPANIPVEVELEMLAIRLDARSVSSRPADWTSWLHDITPLFLDRKMIEEWPKCIEEVWGMIDSFNISAFIGYGHSSPRGLENLSRGAISNGHMFHLFQLMIPGKFLCLQFPRGFPPHIKKLNLRNPLIVNCAEILHMLRNCQHLNDLSLFVVFNTEAHDGLPPGLETLELFESGGTILPDFYAGLRLFRYTFIGEPRAEEMSIVRHFIEYTPIGQLELNAVSSTDLVEAAQGIRTTDAISDKIDLGRHLLQNVSFNQFGNCRISKRATWKLKEYIISLASSHVHGVRRP